MVAYKKVLLKISGEALKGEQDCDIFESETLKKMALMIKKIYDQGVDVGIVIGAGNIWRGRVAKDFDLDRINADYMGMVATIINALVLKDVLKRDGLDCLALSALGIDGVIDAYDEKKAKEAFDNHRVVIFGGGTGKPLLSTDTAAALRAKEIGAEIILAAKNGVDGVYDSDPLVNKNAKFLKHVTYEDYFRLNLKALDAEAIKICEENEIIVQVFNGNDLENVNRVINGFDIGTKIGKEK